MKEILDSIEKSLKEKNWYGALFVTLTLPDICAALESPDNMTNQKLYTEWFDKNMSEYMSMSGIECYAMRCALLHQGKDNINDQPISSKTVLEDFLWISNGRHMIRFENCNVDGKEINLLQLSVDTFCHDFCSSVKKWETLMSTNKAVADKMMKMIQIHEPGYRIGPIKFI